MFDSERSVWSTRQLAQVVADLGRLDPAVGDAERIDQIRLLEEVKAATAAAQATVAAAFMASQRAEQVAKGVPATRVGRGTAGQVGLARRESPYRASRYLGCAAVLVGELPHTLAALRHGEVTEWRAMIVARETAWLSREHRTTVDAALAGRLESLGDRGVEAETKKLAYRLDPHGYLARIRGADSDRRVTLRPAPDTMARLTALLPAAQGVAAYAALTRAADTARAAGDPRGRGQVMADTLVQRVTGQASADGVPVEVNLVMTDKALFNLREPAAASAPVDESSTATGTADTGANLHPTGLSAAAQRALGDAGADEPAVLPGYGPTQPSWPVASSPPTRPPLGGYGASTPTRTPRPSWSWSRGGASSTPGYARSLSSATRSVAPPGVTRPYDTPTTPSRSWPAVPPAPTTAKDSARPATTPKRHPAGTPRQRPTTPGALGGALSRSPR